MCLPLFNFTSFPCRHLHYGDENLQELGFSPSCHCTGFALLSRVGAEEGDTDDLRLPFTMKRR
jgi:hypothetical protein